ncbi:unnamed protein product [Thlaspi arvense]|uniref:AB hydrolase-1 domain-containing protein n=1 Tax=Thlaspi arvense TaxID=13288 RepID=A0AAU9RKH5_THLAR|nr:unnamed protein product [Thlaspi arvense]
MAMAVLCPLPANLPSAGITRMPRSVLTRDFRMRVPYELKQDQSRLFHNLPSGLDMEVIFQRGRDCRNPDKRRERSENPALVFVHGSFHAAWCWAEHWLPFFSQNGYDCYALSLLGQGESDAPAGPVVGTLQTHAADVADFIKNKIRSPPVLLGHSFGGLIVQSYVANIRSGQMSESLHPDLSGAVLICSVPPSGNSGLVWRYLFSKPIAAFKGSSSLSKGEENDLESHNVTQDMNNQKLMTESSRMPLFDLRKLNASLPVPSSPEGSINILVIGASDDFIVDAEGLRETGRFYGVSPVCIEGVAHDLMLDCSWEKGASAILSWLSGLS